MIYRRCLAVLGDGEEARDASHDIYLLLVDRLDGFAGESALSTWIYRVATNHCLNRLRARGVAARAVVAMSECLTQGAEPQPAQHSERTQLLRWLLGKFNPRTVQIVVHTYYDEMTQTEIAQVVGISERAVRKALKRFRDQASALLEAVERMGEAS
jgi:RNA polymerase sigma-70 factor (ECF subfamily)